MGIKRKMKISIISALALLLLLSVNTVYADDVYIAYKWAAPGAKSFTESWVILSDTKYDTSTALGMQLLIKELAALKKTDTVVVYYVRPLRGAVGPQQRNKLNNSGEISI